MSMNREQYQQLAIRAGLMAVVLALVSGRLPRWVRIVLVLGLVALACGAGLFGYRTLSEPKTLTVAAGSLDGDAPRIISAFAAHMASTKSAVRLKVVSKDTATDAAKAFSAGETDLAIVRADAKGLGDARTVVDFTRAVVLIVVPPGSSLDSMDDLKGKTVGVIGSDVNEQVVEVISREYDLARAKVVFKNLSLADASKALQAKQVQALLVVMPITQKYLSMLREILPRDPKRQPGLIAIESAEAIANVARAYESYDLPKGTLRGSPPIPDDDLTTLRVPLYLVANKKIDADAITALTKAIMDARRDLIGEFPVLAQIKALSTDKDTFIPIHPGASAYFEGDQKTFFDKYGDQFFYGSMLLGTLASLFAAIWKFMTRDSSRPEMSPLMRLYALTDHINVARNEADLQQTEQQASDILKLELEKYATGKSDAGEAAALGLATHRLEYLTAQRRAALNGQGKSTAQA